MLFLRHVFFFLAPAAVLSAPHTESSNGISNSETAASELSGRADNAAAAPFFVDPRHVIEMRHDQITADTVIEIPPDQMSGSVRVHYDPDLDPVPIQKPATSPVPRSPLVKRDWTPDPISQAHCVAYHDPSRPNALWSVEKARCAPERGPRAYDVWCEHWESPHAQSISMAQPGECEQPLFCWQKPVAIDRRGEHHDITCINYASATKVTTPEDKGLRGLLKSVVKVFPKPPFGKTRMLHMIYVLDRNGNPLQAITLRGVSNGLVFAQRDNANGYITEQTIGANGASDYWQADIYRQYATLEWMWKWVA